MKPRLFILLLFCIASSVLLAKGNPDSRSFAIDMKGVRHQSSEYKGQAPWMTSDVLKKMGVEYSYDDRRGYHQGDGVFRLILDPKTGAVNDIVVIKSTGVATLDRSVFTSLRQWRWKPGKWKEITIPVNFHMTATPEPLKPGEISLPHP